MHRRPLALAALVLVAAVAPAAAIGAAGSDAQARTQAQEQTDAYTGTHVSVDVNGSAVADYAVDGDTVATDVRVQSAGDVESDLGIGVGAELGAVTEIAGAALSVDATTTTEARITAEGGATVRVNDDAHGTLVIDAGDREQYVTLGVNASTEVRGEGEGRVLVETDSGTEATVMVVGDGEAAVNDDGNVTARVAADASLVVRSYPEGRDEADRREAALVANGTATAEVFVDRQDGETVAGTVRYGANTTVDVEHEAEGEVHFTAERPTHEGTVVLASVTNATADAEGDLSVRVDGSAAARAATTAELRAAANGETGPKYAVSGDASGEARVTVLVAIDHFSERDVTVTDGGSDGSDGTDGSDESEGGDGTDGSDGSETTDGSDGGDTANGSGDGIEAGDGDDTTVGSDDGVGGDGGDASDGEDAGDTTGAGGPGFGVVAGLTAVIVLSTGVLVRRRSR